MSDTPLLAAGPAPDGHGMPLGAAASGVGHGLLLASLLFLVPVSALVAPAPQPITVELVTPEEVAALSAPPAPQQPALPMDETTVAPVLSEDNAGSAAAPQSPAHSATQFYAADILRDPAAARIRQTLGTVADRERIVQLCNIEGLEQIRRAEPQYDPDTIVGYAMADLVTTGLTLNAAGAAFRSRRKWYGFSFDCTVAPGYDAVTAFSFSLGDPIPEDQWEAHNLNAEDSDEDEDE